MPPKSADSPNAVFQQVELPQLAAAKTRGPPTQGRMSCQLGQPGGSRSRTWVRWKAAQGCPCLSESVMAVHHCAQTPTMTRYALAREKGGRGVAGQPSHLGMVQGPISGQRAINAQSKNSQREDNAQSTGSRLAVNVQSAGSQRIVNV